MSPQYGELQPTNGWDRFGSLGHPSKFQLVSRFGFVTASTSLTGSQPNFARCLAVSWAGALYIHFQGLLPLREFCQLQNSLYVQVSCSPILAALLHDIPAAGVSQTLRRRTRNGPCPCNAMVKPLCAMCSRAWRSQWPRIKDRFEPWPGRVRLLKELFQIIPMHMMTREIIPGRKTEGSTVSSINCDRSSLI